MHTPTGRLQETPRDLPFDHPLLASSEDEACRQITVVGRHSAARGQHYPAHYHAALELVLYRHGHAEVLLETPGGLAVVEVHGGSLLVTPPGIVHADRALGAYANTYLLIEPARLSLGFSAPRLFRDDADRHLERVFQGLADEWRGREPGRERMLDLLTDQLDVLLLRLAAQPALSAGELLVRRMERLLDERYAENPSVLDLARELGASPSGLRALFTRLRGYSPKAYLQAVRLERALDLIRSSSLSLEVVAAMHGYDSASHLSRHVKQATGQTPGSYRVHRGRVAPPAGGSLGE